VVAGCYLFVFQVFVMQAATMAPTLVVSDHVLASRYPYGYGQYSLPFPLPSFSGRFFGHEPSRGDIVVFRWPDRDGGQHVDRLIGMPGERIQLLKGILYINGEPVKREQIRGYALDRLWCPQGVPGMAKRWRETLPNGVQYEILACTGAGPYQN